MWLAYAAGVLEETGFEVRLRDAPASGMNIDQVLQEAQDYAPELIVLDTSTPSIYNDLTIGEKLKEVCPQAFVTMVGTHVSALPETSLLSAPKIDAIARYEYDYTLRDLAKALQSRKSLLEIPGLVLYHSGQIISTPPRPFITELDKLPFVSRVYKKHLDIWPYFNPNCLHPMITLTTSRGCSGHCTFCLYPQTLMGRKVRYRSPENVVAELEYISQEFPWVKGIFFEDDTLTINLKHCQKLCELILQKNLKIKWTANARVNNLDLDTMHLMKKAGCRSLCVGFESGTQDLLDNVNKKITLEQMYKFMSYAKRAGILIHGCFIAGLPGETRDTLKNTLELAKKLKPDTVQFFPLMVYPGTEVYSWYQETGRLVTNDFSQWLTPDGLHNCVIQTSDLSNRDLVAFCDQARKKFYLRPSYLIYKGRQITTSWAEMHRTLKTAKTFLKYLWKGSFKS
jgi:radical SAM superfamily enzyme YgiQ (UPF0313 family)